VLDYPNAFCIPIEFLENAFLMKKNVEAF